MASAIGASGPGQRVGPALFPPPPASRTHCVLDNLHDEHAVQVPACCGMHLLRLPSTAWCLAHKAQEMLFERMSNGFLLLMLSNELRELSVFSGCLLLVEACPECF